MEESRVVAIATEPKGRSPRSPYIDHLSWSIAAIVGISYFFGLTPGHVFVQDDFAAYAMHAANIVEGRPYSEIHYVPNGEAPWVSPANGYPPVYPLLLAPVYWRLGRDLHAMKMVTVGAFVIFLAAFKQWVKPLAPPGRASFGGDAGRTQPGALELSGSDLVGVSVSDVFVPGAAGDSSPLGCRQRMAANRLGASGCVAVSGT